LRHASAFSLPDIDDFPTRRTVQRRLLALPSRYCSAPLRSVSPPALPIWHSPRVRAGPPVLVAWSSRPSHCGHHPVHLRRNSRSARRSNPSSLRPRQSHSPQRPPSRLPVPCAAGRRRAEHRVQRAQSRPWPSRITTPTACVPRSGALPGHTRLLITLTRRARSSAAFIVDIASSSLLFLRVGRLGHGFARDPLAQRRRLHLTASASPRGPPRAPTRFGLHGAANVLNHSRPLHSRITVAT